MKSSKMLTLTKFCKEVSHIRPMFPVMILPAHTKTCPAKKKGGKKKSIRGRMPKPKGPLGPSTGSASAPVCPGTGGGGGGTGGPGANEKSVLKRALASGKVRMGLIPEEYFLFFHSKTGVTGPYLFGIMLTNYLVSKEKFVMEHEYYIGLSMFVMSYYVSTTFGSTIGAVLDKEVDAIASTFEKIRTDEIATHEGSIKQAQDAQGRAQGQQLLMNAKKENIAMQLEAIHRERLMHVYKTVRGRMDYHVKLYRSQARIQQKWMLGWILKRVMESITPELEQQALTRAISDLAAAASKAQK